MSETQALTGASGNFSTYLVVLSSGGLHHPQLLSLKGEREAIANLLTPLLNRGMEVTIFSTKVDPRGTYTWTPTGGTHLKEEFYLYDARPEVQDKVDEIKLFLSGHSQHASNTYLDILLEELRAEQVRVKADL